MTPYHPMYDVLAPQQPETVQFAAPTQVFVPVTARDRGVYDNGGELVCQCFTPALALRVAELINADNW